MDAVPLMLLLMVFYTIATLIGLVLISRKEDSSGLTKLVWGTAVVLSYIYLMYNVLETSGALDFSLLM